MTTTARSQSATGEPRGPSLVIFGLALAAAALMSFAPELGAADDDDKNARTGSVWVVNRDRGELVIFDAGTGAVVATRQVGAGAHDICISERSRKAYIAAESVNVVTTVDTTTLAVESIPVGPLPHHVEPSRDGRTVYVSLASHSPLIGTAEYAAIDTWDDSVTYTTSSRNPAARPHAMQLSHDDRDVYVAHDVGDEVTAVESASGSLRLSVGPIFRAEEVIPTRAGRYLWVSSRGDGTVKRIDLRTQSVTGSVPVGVQPESVMLTPSERTLVVSMRGTPAALGFVDTVEVQLLGIVSIAGAGTFGDLAVITDDGRHVYATYDAGPTGRGGIAVVDVRSREVIDTWDYPGTGRPHGIWYSKRKPRFRVDQ